MVDNAFASFELNQSCPSLGKQKHGRKYRSVLKKLTNFTGVEHDSCSYLAANIFEHFAPDVEPNLDDQNLKSQHGSRPLSSLSFNASWSSLPENSFVFDGQTNFPSKTSHKAVLTIDANTSQVLTANKQACILFEHTSDTICLLSLTSLFKKSYKNDEQKKTIMFDIDDARGNLTVMSGNVKEIITKHGKVIPVSVWMRRYEAKDGRKLCVVVLETVARITGKFTFNTQHDWVLLVQRMHDPVDPRPFCAIKFVLPDRRQDISGDILSCDDDFARIHGFPSATSLENINLKQMMPAYEIPQFGCRLAKSLRKQYTTSTTVDGTKFPLSVYLHSQERDEKAGKFFSASVWFFTNISGPMTASSSGVIQNINSNFALSLLGYTAGELKHKDITTLLPDVAEEHSNVPECVQEESSESLVPLPKSSEDRLSNSSSQEILSSDSRSGFVNISMPLSSQGSKSPNSPPSSALEKINSLLLGKSPLCSPSKKEVLSPEKEASYGCAFRQRTIDDSWVEVSLNPGSKPADSCVHESDSIRKINLLLNGSTDLLLLERERSQGSIDSDGTKAKKLSNESLSSPNYPSIDSSPVLRGQVSLNGSNKENTIDSNSTKSSESIFASKTLSENRAKLLQTLNVTSTPLNQEKRKSKMKCPLREGCFEGEALHKNGSLIAVTYDVRFIPQCAMYCIWLSLGAESQRYSSSLNSNQTLYSSFNSTLPSLNASFVGGICDQSLGSAIKQAAQRLNESSDSVFLPQEGTDEWLAIQGKFGESYEIKRAIGNGAFGFVRNAKHRKTSKKFVVKFIRKEKVLEECWVDDYEFESMIPLEIALLAKFDHPNIVKVIDFFENENFFAMIMPTHGIKGMDLFEFIDREPTLNELIASYIFRQIAAAVYFLHREGVVHRDIKDENVIIDENFTCKLIDFGSAAFFKTGQTFATFCGTVEYCSPEVLMGERYEGPALEVWSLGVTLYTLVFGTNPFADIEETVEAQLNPPYLLSPELMVLIRNMLQPVPEFRHTIRDIVSNDWVNIPVDISVYSWDQVVPPAKRKRSYVTLSSHSKSNLQSDDESFLSNNDSMMSSRETLADHLRKWKKEAGDERDPKELPAKDDLLPLSKRLENINLNHSI